MKKFFKFIGIGVLALIVLGIVASMFGGGGESTQTTTTPKTEEAKADTKPKAEKPKEEPKQAKIGDVLTVGKVDFKVSKKEEATAVGGEFGQKAKGKFLILDVSVANKGDKALLVDSSFFKLKVDGKEYEADAGAGVYVNENADFFFTEINPDITLDGRIVFDIPAELLQKDLTLNVQTGMFGTEQGQINLQ